MLKQLTIKNFIFIKNACINFSDRFNVITGETGAGKSILINALSITLGKKIDLNLIRPGENKIEVTSIFDIKSNSLLKKKYKHIGIEQNPNQELILKREVSKNGKSRCLINGNLSTLNLLKEIAEKLIDIHSQHQNQYLFNSENHLYFFDQTLNIKKELMNYKKNYFHLKKLRKKLSQLQTEKKQLQEEKDFLLYSLKEFEGKFLNEEEYLKLKERLKEFEIFEKNNHDLTLLKEITFNQAIPTLEKAMGYIEKISLPKNLQKKPVELQAIIEQIRTLSEEILNGCKFKENYSYLHEIDKLNQKLSGTEKLLRKYNTDHKSLYDKYENIKKKLEHLENIEFERKKLLNALTPLENDCISAALTLHKRRKEGISVFEKKINQQIKELEIKNGSFKPDLTPSLNNDPHSPQMLEHLNERGLNKLEFVFSAGKGVEHKPLKKIASGGELSRIMLAIKHLLNQSLPNESIVFDEIDTGVGGIAAVKIGKKIKEISLSKQVVVITHLPQIAKYAERHFCIEKNTNPEGKPETSIHQLDGNELLEEFTRMMGKEVSEKNLKITEKIIYEK